MTDPFVVPPSFWAEVSTSLWKQAPRVWRRPFDPAYGAEHEVFRALCALTARLDTGDASIQPRVFLDDKQAGFSLDRHSARPDDVDLAGFERRLLAGLGGRELGMVIGDAAILDDVLWRRAVHFLRGLHAAVGTPAGGSHAEIFFGNYQRSFFGAHKDRLETFTFVVRGRKRFLTWPYEALLGLPGVPPDAPLHAFAFDDLDLAPLRDQAVVLEGGPGDVLFWPASWWHVAESVEEGFVTTLTLACAPSTMLAAGSPLRLAQEGFDEAGKDGYYTEDPELPDARGPEGTRAAIDAVEAALARVLEDETFQRGRREATLAWLSASGFKRGPDRLPLPELVPTDRLVADAQILYADITEDAFTCAVNGILLQSTPKFVELVEHINGGGMFTVAELVERFAGGDDQPAADELVEALAHLTSARALRLL
ncbi:MAG: cupin-like domain-containing protein [Pseudomonadota bacterium]|nr:cupin-like domain-containing protein [Pseudomonadota bacterium]